VAGHATGKLTEEKEEEEEEEEEEEPKEEGGGRCRGRRAQKSSTIVSSMMYSDNGTKWLWTDRAVKFSAASNHACCSCVEMGVEEEEEEEEEEEDERSDEKTPGANGDLLNSLRKIGRGDNLAEASCLVDKFDGFGLEERAVCFGRQESGPEEAFKPVACTKFSHLVVVWVHGFQGCGVI